MNIYLILANHLRMQDLKDDLMGKCINNILCTNVVDLQEHHTQWD